VKAKLAEGLLMLLAVAVVARVVYGLLGLSTSGTLRLRTTGVAG